MLDNVYVRGANTWLHYVATGLWAACLLILWVLEQQRPLFASGNLEAWHAIAGVTLLMFQFMLAAVVVIAFTGVLQLVFGRRQKPAERPRGMRWARIGMRAVVALAYAAGTVYASTLVWPL